MSPQGAMGWSMLAAVATAFVAIGLMAQCPASPPRRDEGAWARVNPPPGTTLACWVWVSDQISVDSTYGGPVCVSP